MSNDHTQPEPDHAASDQPMLSQGLKSLYDVPASGVSESARARLDARVLDLAKGHFASVAPSDAGSSDHRMRLHTGPVAGDGGGAGRTRRNLPLFVRYRWAITGVGLAAALTFAFVLSTQTNTPIQPQPTTPNYGLTAANESATNTNADPRGPLPGAGGLARTGTGASPTIGASDIDAAGAGATLAAKPGQADASTNPAWYDELLRKTESARTPDIVDAHRVALLASAAIVPTFAQPDQVGQDIRAALSLGGTGALTFAEVDQLASRAVNLNLGASPGAGIDCPDFWALDIPSETETFPADEFVRPNMGEGRGTGS